MLKSTMTLGDRLQQLMKQKGVSPTELSDRTGIALAHISQLRHGQRSPSRKTLERLSQGLGVSVDDLLSSKPPVQAKEYPSDFDKEILLFKEAAKKYGVEGVRTAREMLPVIFKKQPSTKKQ